MHFKSFLLIHAFIGTNEPQSGIAVVAIIDKIVEKGKNIKDKTKVCSLTS